MNDERDLSLLSIPSLDKISSSESSYNNLKPVNWEIPPCDICIHYNQLIHQGTFSNVYLATWHDTIVAAKMININIECSREKLLKELDIMSKLHHPNIVQIFGYINFPFTIIMEYFSNGSLNKTKYMTQSRKKQITKDIVSSVLYLHNRKPFNIIHRDITLSNVFLTESYRAKLGDFSGPNFDTNIYDMPDIDIYSLGVLFYELYEGKKYHPKKDLRWLKTPKKLRYMIKYEMLSLNPNERPTINEIYERIVRDID